MKPELKVPARQVFMDFTRGVLDRIRERIDEIEKEKDKIKNTKRREIQCSIKQP
jgi:hypothetical protein